MVSADPSILLSDITKLPAKLKRKLDAHGINDLAHLFLAETKLQDAVTLATNTDLTIRGALEARQIARRYFETILADITAKRKVESLGLLWKIHWLLGVVPEGDFRNELIALEASAIAAILEALEVIEASTVEQILQILLHRLLIIPKVTMKAELTQLVEFAEKFQRSSLLAYQTTKAKDSMMALADEDDPTKQVVLIRKLTTHWKTLHKTMQDRSQERGTVIVTALQSTDDLRVLDISEQHLQERLQQTMSTKKLRQSQLKHITTAMNAMFELRDAYSTAKLATRASQIWFELAQGKSSKALGDDLLRSLRFARTAIFNYRALDDLNRAVKQINHIILLLGEIPFEPAEPLEEAVTSAFQTLIRTIPLLDRPADQEFILRISKRLGIIQTRLMPKIAAPEAQSALAKLQIEFQQTALKQLQHLGATSETYQPLTQELIEAQLRLVDVAPEDEKDILLNAAAEHATQLIPEIRQTTEIDENNLELISRLVQQLAQRPKETLSDSAHRLREKSHQLNEQLYFQTKDPQIRAQLALQLLLSKVSPDPSGRVTITFPSKDLDKLEDYATTAMLAQVKGRQQVKALKAGSLLVWILIQRLSETTESKELHKLRDDAQEFAEQTLAFMPPSNELTGEAYPFAFLLLRNVNALAYEEQPAEETKWEQLLTQSEQLAQTLAKAAALKKDTRNGVLALSAAGTATAKLATLTSDRSSQTRLLRRAATQLQKALEVVASDEDSADIEAVLSQYTQLMRARLSVTPALSAQIPLFEEWNQTFKEGIDALRSRGADDSANKLQASLILNTQVPLAFTRLSKEKATLDSVRRKLLEMLREVGQIGSEDQAKLAQQLERRWTFQLGDNSLLDSGYRLEGGETGFTLADEHFRISLQVELEIAIDGRALRKMTTFPYLRPSTKSNDLIWYDKNPILSSTYENDQLQTWLTLLDPSENHVSIGFWLVPSEDTKTTLTLQILGTEAMSQGAEGVMVQLTGSQLEIPRQPAVAERRDTKGILIYESKLTVGFPDTIRLNLRIA
ncbi:MAG: hypothetical protein ACFE9D_07900 [Promethearchaeota archaeon]